MRRVVSILGIVLSAGCMSAGSSRDTLHRIVAACLDTGDPRYCARCSFPQAGSCPLDYPCARTTQVWALDQEYVAIRDLKMCGCEAGFVHGSEGGWVVAASDDFLEASFTRARCDPR